MVSGDGRATTRVLHRLADMLRQLARPGIGRRFGLSMLLFSTLITLLLTTIDLALEYRRGVADVERQVSQVHDNFASRLAISVGSHNLAELRFHLEDMLQRRDVVYAAAYDSANRLLASAGSEPGGDVIWREYPVYSDVAGREAPLGRLVLVAQLERVDALVQSQLLSALLFHGSMVALVAIFSMLLFYWLVGRYLSQITDYTSRVDADTMHQTMRLQLAATPDKRGDELADVVNAMNDMRKRLSDAYRALQESEFRWKFALEGVGDGVWDWNTETGATVYSDLWKSMLGYAAHEIRNKYAEWVVRIHPDDLSHVLAEVEAYMQGRSAVFQVEHRLRCKDGSWKWILTRGMAVSRDKRGLPLRLIGTHSDISERKEVQQALAESEARFRAIFEQVPVGVALVSTEDGRFLTVNQRYCDIVGRTHEQMLATTFSDITFPEDTSLSQEHIERLKRGDIRQFTIEKRYTRPDGTVVWVELSVAAMWPAGEQPTSHVTVVEDITGRKAAAEREQQLTAQLLQATKMEAIGHLTSGIAHDFNNILGAIIGYAELTRHALAHGGEAANVQRYLDSILGAGERAKQLVAQMMLFSRSAPSAQGDSQLVNAVPVVEEVVSLLRASLPATVTLKTGPLDDACVLIEPVKLQQILLNLGINARDATDEYGLIEFSVRHLSSGEQVCASCHQTVQGEYVDITVQDSGSGIDAETRRHIFDPFFTTKGVGKGTGMGLAVVHGIVHAAGGHILLQSEPGQGTVFRILLPVADSAGCARRAEQAGRLEHQPQALAGVRVMVVDDELAIATMLEDLFGMWGSEVRMFQSPMAALAAFAAAPEGVDIVVTDESMPGLSGLHLAEQMLAMRPDLPVVLCTGYSEHVNSEEARQRGIAAFMYKPVDVRQLVRTVQDLVAGRNSGGSTCL